MGRIPLKGVLVMGNMGGEEDREPRPRIDRVAMARLKRQPGFVKVSRGVLYHKAGIAHRVHWQLRTTSRQKVYAGEIALAVVLMGGDEAAGGDDQGAVFAVVRV